MTTSKWNSIKIHIIRMYEQKMGKNQKHNSHGWAQTESVEKDGKACDLTSATINTCDVKPGVSCVILACFKNIMKNS